MSITDELRDCIRTANRSYEDTRDPFNDREVLHILEEELLAIADRIDIAHKHAIGYVDDRDPETMAENGWVRLPKDADGEYIHIGDRMENNERVARIVLTDESWEPSVYVEKLPNVLHEHFCHEISHYRAPTVEDVLEELLREYGRDDSELTNGEIIERFAAKLRLVGDAE